MSIAVQLLPLSIGCFLPLRRRFPANPLSRSSFLIESYPSMDPASVPLPFPVAS
ncbi:hypothetical protein [Dyella sp.]|uniref:hypothetical protein n=1 Tax=Dyella sp. TaxID=1869338 RepID=UPI003F7E8C6A